ncbi:hypothetical protein ACFLYQ_02800 [Chloroflexota bacterium]
MKTKPLILASLVVMLALTGCFADINKVALGDEFQLKIGESAAIQGENLNITFLEVLEDSRCPKNVTCIWAGRANSLVRITITDTTGDIELIEPGLTDTPNQYTYRNYQITYYLLPYPENAGESLEYHLLLKISPNMGKKE